MEPGPSYDGRKYILTFVDDCTRFAKVYLLTDKSSLAVLNCIRDYKITMELQTGHKWKELRSDCGREYLGEVDRYLEEIGVVRNKSVPRCPQMNGAAERFNQTLEDKVKCFLLESCMPSTYWPLAVKAATFLYNLLPHSSLAGSSPYKKMFPGKVDFLDRGGKLHQFGSAAFRWIPNEERKLKRRNKFAPNSEKLVFVGYDSLDSDVYLLLKPGTRSVIRERNVTVLDGQYPYCEKKEDPACKCKSPVNQRCEGHETQEVLSFTLIRPQEGEPSGQSDNEATAPAPSPSYSGVSTPSSPKPTQYETLVTSPVENSFDSESSEDESSGDDEEDEEPEAGNEQDESKEDEPVQPEGPAAGDDITTPVLRRSDRERRPPVRFQYDKQGNQVLAFYQTDPKSHDEAMTSPYAAEWREAENAELRALLETNTFDEVDEQPGMKVIDMRWVFVTKTKPGGPIDCHKARLVAKGFQQREGEDFWQTYAPTVAAATIRTFLAVAMSQEMIVHQMDVSTAFLNGDIDGLIHVRPPKPFQVHGRVWRLNKSLYGLKQSPRCWAAKFTSILTALNFQQSKADKCLFVRKDGEELTYLLVYVDDVLIATKEPTRMSACKEALMSQLKMKDLGKVGTFLGIDFDHVPGSKIVTLSQRRYIDKLAKVFDLNPDDKVYKLESIDATTLADEPIENELIESGRYRSIIGGLLFISSMTRPDVAAAISYLSRFLDRPSAKAWTLATRVLKYLMTTKELPLVIGDVNGSGLVTYVDANFAPAGDRKSQTGVLIRLNGSSVSWQSKKQKTVATSTTEAEYVALSIAVNETLWIQKLLGEMHYSVQYPTPVMEDNEPAMHIAKNQKNVSLAKHIDVKYHATQDYQEKGFIDVQHIGTEDQLADALTKVKTKAQDAYQLLGDVAIGGRVEKHEIASSLAGVTSSMEDYKG